MELTSTMHVAKWDVLLVTRYAQLLVCVRCDKKGHWAVCCRSEAESRAGGGVRGGRARASKNRQSSDWKRDLNSGD